MKEVRKLVNEYRSDVLDLVHFGHLVIVNEASNVIFKVGDPDVITFYRSSSKPVQALPVIERCLDKLYGFTDEETVLFGGSHCGDDIHVSCARSMIEKSAVLEDMFVMKPAVPHRTSSNEARIRLNLPPGKLYQNCVGKHIASVLLQRSFGEKEENYWKPDSPAQREIMKTICIIDESDMSKMKIGIDGCGVPVFAVGLRHIATAFKNLAAPEKIKDDALQKAVISYVPRIHKYPHMMRGEGYLCTILNKDPNIIAKGGANGVYGFSLKKEKLGIAFKIADGSQGVWPFIVREVLHSLHALSAETDEHLAALDLNEIKNDSGCVVGYREIAFKI